jgi:hypothetical protein
LHEPEILEHVGRESAPVIENLSRWVHRRVEQISFPPGDEVVFRRRLSIDFTIPDDLPAAVWPEAVDWKPPTGTDDREQGSREPPQRIPERESTAASVNGEAGTEEDVDAAGQLDPVGSGTGAARREDDEIAVVGGPPNGLSPSADQILPYYVPLSVLQKWPPVMHLDIRSSTGEPMPLLTRTQNGIIDSALLVAVARRSLKLDPAQPLQPHLKDQLCELAKAPPEVSARIAEQLFSAPPGSTSLFDTQRAALLEDARFLDIAGGMVNSTVFWLRVYGRRGERHIVKFAYDQRLEKIDELKTFSWRGMGWDIFPGDIKVPHIGNATTCKSPYQRRSKSQMPTSTCAHPGSAGGGPAPNGVQRSHLPRVTQPLLATHHRQPRHRAQVQKPLAKSGVRTISQPPTHPIKGGESTAGGGVAPSVGCAGTRPAAARRRRRRPTRRSHQHRRLRPTRHRHRRRRRRRRRCLATLCGNPLEITCGSRWTSMAAMPTSTSPASASGSAPRTSRSWSRSGGSCATLPSPQDC